MMNLAYVSTYAPQRCGIATYTSFLVKGIREVDSDVKIRIIAEKDASAVEQKMFEVIPCWSRNENYVEQILPHVDDSDLIHIQHEYSIYKFDDRLPSLIEKLPSRIKKVLTIHCVRPGQVSERGSLDEDYAKRIAELADHVIVHLESQRAILLRCGISPRKVSVIPHGTELSNEDPKFSRKKLGLPVKGRIILMFGFVKPHKCLHIALEALHEMLKERLEVFLFVAGGLPPNASKEQKDYAKLVNEKIRELKLEKRVIFPNRFFPDEDVPFIFRACDLVLFPYYEEDRSASGSLHLAIGAGKPIIASRIPKFEELRNISDELLVLPFNSTAIAKLALRLFTEQDFEKYIIKRTEEYRNLTSWKKIAERHMELYKKLVSI
jgi:glycosyltransferase involved in cell wall biosynthesis